MFAFVKRHFSVLRENSAEKKPFKLFDQMHHVRFIKPGTLKNDPEEVRMLFLRLVRHHHRPLLHHPLLHLRCNSVQSLFVILGVCINISQTLRNIPEADICTFRFFLEETNLYRISCRRTCLSGRGRLRSSSAPLRGPLRGAEAAWSTAEALLATCEGSKSQNRP